jgi:hypothetical protein
MAGVASTAASAPSTAHLQLWNACAEGAVDEVRQALRSPGVHVDDVCIDQENYRALHFTAAASDDSKALDVMRSSNI